MRENFKIMQSNLCILKNISLDVRKMHAEKTTSKRKKEADLSFSRGRKSMLPI